jgi:hypothetical protein
MGHSKCSFRLPLIFGGGAMLAILCGSAAAGPAQYPFSIPEECVALAQREGMPTTISNRYQAVKAKYKLYRMNKSDPLVRQCRAAVRRAEHLLKERVKLERTTLATENGSP